MNKNKINLTILILLIIPVILWFFAPAPVARFSNLTTTLANFGQICGLVGTVLFALSLILSARLKIFDKLYAGLNRVYAQHNNLGQVGFILLLCHPLLLIPKYTGNVLSAVAGFLLPGDVWSINWGIFALTLLIILIVLTLYLKPRYHWWKWTHKFMGLAFFLAGLHIWLIASDVSRFWPLRVYILTIIFVALILFIYHTLLNNPFRKKFIYKIDEVVKLVDNIVEVKMLPVGDAMNFQAGQYVFIKIKNKKISRESHPFSISSSPNEKFLTLTIKNLGDYTGKIDNELIGSMVTVDGQFGQFFPNNDDVHNQIWIAGGIGITPFVSRLKALKPKAGDIDLYYSAKNKTQLVYRELLESFAPGVRMMTFYSDQNCRLEAEVIAKISEPIIKKQIYICAPPRMITSLTKELITLGVNRKNIHSEEFNF